MEQVNQQQNTTPQPLPYTIPPERAGSSEFNSRGRPTTITTEQRMWDSDVYCREMKDRILAALRTGELPYAADTLFMHDAVYPPTDTDPNMVDPQKSNIKLPWWDDVDALKMWADGEKMKEARPAETKVDEYLQRSNESTG